MTDQPFRPPNRDRRVAVGLFLGLLVIFGGLYVAGYLFTSDKVPRGTTVAGIDIGELEPAAAERVLTGALRDDAGRPVLVSAAGRRTRIDPQAAGLSLDAAGSVAQVGVGRSWHPGRMWDFFTGGDDYPAVATVDRTRLRVAVQAFADDVDQPAREGRVTFDRGRASAHPPRTGRALDVDASVDTIRTAYLSQAHLADGVEPVPLPVTEVEPEITEDEVRAAMDEFANPAMSAPVFFRVGGERVVLRPEEYSRALTLEDRDGSLVPTVDPEALLKSVRPAMRKGSLAPRNATVRLVDGRPKVVPARNGITFDPDGVTAPFLDAVVRDDDRTVRVDSVVDKPEFSTADARKLQIKEVVSSFTTYFPHADYRNTNLGRAAELINGTVLRPGETFSLNDTVGERTAANGFTKGFIISDGVYKEDFGGGVSQVATTTFNAAFFAGLEDVEHKPHSFYIDRYPIGREATVAWGAVDLRFKNDTPYGILVQAGITPSSPTSQGSMTVKMWSTKYWDITAGASERYNFTQPETRHLEGEECVPNTGYGGFDIDVYRYFHKPGRDKVVRKETMHTTYTPSDTVVCS